MENNIVKLVRSLGEMGNKQTRKSYREKEISLRLDGQG